MYHELPIQTPMGKFTVFLQQGFYSGLACCPFHNHNYTEVHLILDGAAKFTVAGTPMEIANGQMLIIPPKTLHACVQQDKEARRAAFQIDCDLCQELCAPTVASPDEPFLHAFFDEIRHCSETGDYTLLSAVLALLCCRFCKGERVEAKTRINYGFVIHEFFFNRYREEIRLSDLANELHLSQRQTERLVLEHMGNTFRKTLAATRVLIAKQLMESSTLSLGEIAEYVGYRSYAGFWKAMKQSDPGR